MLKSMTLSKLVLSIIFALIINDISFSQLQIQDYYWQTNGEVRDIEEDTVNNILYLGGSFNYIGKNLPYGVKIDTSSNEPEPSYPNPNGRVNTAISDDNGGWFIGGDFTMVGDSSRSRLAHINNLGQVTSWKADANDEVFAIAKSGDTLYIGGQFSTISGNVRNYLASVKASTSDLLFWNPPVNDNVRSIETYENHIFVGGYFNSKILAFDIYGNSSSFNINANQVVNVIKVYNDTLFIGGNFTNVYGQLRRGLASFDLNNNSLTSINYDLYGVPCRIYDITKLNNSIYVCGFFTDAGPYNRTHVAKINLSSGVIDPQWNPSLDYGAYAISALNDRIFLSGGFKTINGQPRSRLAALDTTNGDLINWNPGLGSSASEITHFDNFVYLWGGFTCANGKIRNGLAAVDMNTGEATSWNPSVNNSGVHALALNDSIIFVGVESGTTITGTNGQSQLNLAAVDVNSGELSSWSPYVTGSSFYSLLVVDTTLYVGGAFTSINSMNREDIASFNLNDKTLTSWSPTTWWAFSTSQGVRTIKEHNNILYIGGRFSSVNGVSRNLLASFNTSNGDLTSWNPDVYSNLHPIIYDIEVTDSAVYTGGNISAINGVSRDNFGKLHSINNTLKNWSPNPDDQVFALSKSDDKLYVGGQFTSFDNQPRQSLAEINLHNNSTTNWTCDVNGQVLKLKASKNKLFVCGEYDRINNKGRANFTVLIDTCGYPEIPTISSSGNNICANTTITLEVSSGDLNDAVHWEWYTGNCGGTVIGTGSSISVTPLSTTTYYARGMGGCGEPTQCSQITIDVINTVQPSGSNTQYFCTYDNATINDISVNGNNVQWYASSSGGSPLSGSSSISNGQTYYATQTLNGCESVSKLGVTANIVNINTNVNQQGINLSASQNGASYQWLNCANNYSLLPGATFKNFTPVSNGTFAVQLTLNSCLDTSDCYTINSVSTNKNELNDKLKVYPNPTSDKVTVASQFSNLILSVKLMDANGKVILQRNGVNNHMVEVELSELERGVYFLEMKLEDDSVVYRKVSRN